MAPTIYINDRAWEKTSKFLAAIGTNYRIIETPKQVKPIKRQTPTPQSIFLEARTHEDYSYPDLLVSTDRSYLGQSWRQCKEQLTADNAYMLTIRQFADFLNVLKSGKAFDEKGKRVSSQTLDNLYKEITEVRSPWRAEWLDAYFNRSHRNINYTLINKDGTTQNVNQPVSGLMRDKTPGISLDSWLKTADKHGLPTSKTENGDLYYWNPRDYAVAGFVAYSGGVILNCDRDADDCYDSLGVRVVRKMGEVIK